MKNTITRKEVGTYRILKTKETVHYLNKMEKELVEKLGIVAGEKTYGAISLVWYNGFIDIEDIIKQLNRTYAELFILNISEIIKDSTYEGLKEQLNRIIRDTLGMPM